MRHIGKWDILSAKDNAPRLVRTMTPFCGRSRWKMRPSAHPDSRSLGTASGPWVVRAKDRCFKIPNLSSQKISKDLCNVFFKCQQTIESTGKAHQPLFPGWEQITAFRTSAVVVEIGIYCSKFSFSSKNCVLMNSVEPTVFPCEGRMPKRYPSD